MKKYIPPYADLSCAMGSVDDVFFQQHDAVITENKSLYLVERPVDFANLIKDRQIEYGTPSADGLIAPELRYDYRGG